VFTTRAGAEASRRSQAVGEEEVRHVVGRERQLEAVRGDPAAAEHRARVVHQHVDPWLGRRDLGGHPLGVGDEGEVGVVRDVADTRPPRAQARQGRLATRAVPRHQHQPRAQAGQTLGRDLADSGGAAGHHHDLAVHAPSLYRLGAPRASSKMTVRR
jgi:hypothetical protein